MSQAAPHRPAAERPLLGPWSLAALIAFIGLMLFIRFQLSTTLIFDQDELEHLHAAWSMSQGQVIYRDFFEMHPPVLYFLIAPLMAALEGEAAMFAARGVMLVLSIGILGLVFTLAARRRSVASGLIAVAVVSSITVFIHKSLEIRPDVPATLAFLGALTLATVQRPRAITDLLAGSAFGVALLCTPKMLFPGLGLVLALLLPAVRGSRSWAHPLQFGLGVLLPLTGVALLFHQWGALDEAVFFNFTFIRALPFKSPWTAASASLLALLRDNSLIVCIGLAALFVHLNARFRRARIESRRRHARMRAIELSLASSIIGLFIPYVPMRQYFLVPLALLAILLSGALADLGHYLAARMGRRASRAAMGLILLAICVRAPIAHQELRLFHSNSQQLDQLHYVWNHTEPGDPVFSCWNNLYIFRPRGFFYFCLLPQIMEALDRIDPAILREDLPRALEENPPQLVFVDAFTSELPPDVLDFIRRNYRPSTQPNILIRRESMPEAPAAMVDDDG